MRSESRQSIRWFWQRYSVLAACALAALAAPSQAQTRLFGWGQSWYDSEWYSETFAEVDATAYGVLARRANGTVVAWGDPGRILMPAPDLPAGVTTQRIEAGAAHALALRSNGTIVGWGSNANGQTIVPGLPAGLSYVEVAAGYAHSLAIRSNGTLVAWGDNSS